MMSPISVDQKCTWNLKGSDSFCSEFSLPSNTTGVQYSISLPPELMIRFNGLIEAFNLLESKFQTLAEEVEKIKSSPLCKSILNLEKSPPDEKAA